MAQKLPPIESEPFSVEAERAVLGGVMLKNDTWDLIAGVVFEKSSMVLGWTHSLKP